MRQGLVYQLFSTHMLPNKAFFLDKLMPLSKYGYLDYLCLKYFYVMIQSNIILLFVFPGTPVLALTASADIDSRARVKTALHMDNVNTQSVIVSPNRKNIRLGLVNVSDDTMECLDWIVEEVKEKGLSMSHMLIYCRSVPSLQRVFNYLLGRLDDFAYVDRDPEQKPENLLVGIFQSSTHEEDKRRLLSSLSGGEGSSRVIVATTALGMGLNFRNVSHVIMYGVPEDTEAIVQQAGRAGRDGTQSHAAVYHVKERKVRDEGVKMFLKKSKTECIREALYCKFEQNTERVKPGHACCTHCHSLCSCTTEDCAVRPNYELMQEEVPGRCRQVLPEHKTLIKEKLEEYMAGLIPVNAHLFTSKKACTGFGPEVIDAVLKHSEKIFDLAYVKRHIPLFFDRYANKIVQVIDEVFHDIDLDTSQLETTDCSAYEQPDMYYTGHFDAPDDDTVLTPITSSESERSSLESAMSGLSLMEASE